MIRDPHSIIHNTKLVNDIKDAFETMSPKAMDKRANIEKQWNEYKDIFDMKHNPEKEVYESRYSSIAKIPTASNSLKKLARAVRRNVLPYTRPFEPQPSGTDDVMAYEESLERANRHAKYIEYQMFDTKTNNLRKRILPYITQYILYGLAVARIRHSHHVTTRSVNGIQVKEESLMPAIDFIDIFRWYIYPDKISDIMSAKLIWQWSVVRNARLKAMEKKGYYKNVDKALDMGEQLADGRMENTTTSNSYTINLGQEANKAAKTRSARTNSGPMDRLDIDRELLTREGGYSIIHEGYYIEDVAYTDADGVKHDRDGELEIVNFVYCNGEIIQARIVDELPYLITRVDDLPNEFYQHSSVRPIFRMLYIEEGLLAQTLQQVEVMGAVLARFDSRNGTPPPKKITPITIFDAPPGGFELFRISDTSRNNINTLGLLDSSIRESLFSSPPTDSNVNMRSRGSRTKGGMQQMAEDALQSIIEESMKIEDTLLIPMVEKFHKLNQRIDEDQMVQVPSGTKGELGALGYGHENIKIAPEDIQTPASYRWLGSMRVISESQLSQNAANFLAIASRYGEDQVNVDIVRILRGLYSTGFGQKDAEQVIKYPDGSNKVPIKVIASVLEAMMKAGEIDEDAAQKMIGFIKQLQSQQNQQPGGNGSRMPIASAPFMESINR